MKFPFIPITISLIFGTVLYFYKFLNLEIAVVLLILSFFLIINSYFKKNKILFLFGVSIVFLCVGFIISFLKDPLNQNNHISKNKLVYEKNNSFILEIQQELKPSAKYFRFIANVKQINQEEFSGKLLFCIKKSTFIIPKIGNELLVFDQIQEIPKPKNKFQFDYQKFLFYKDVLGQCYSESKQFKIIDYQKNIYSISNEVRTKIIHSFKKQNISKGSLAIIKALLLGEKQDIDKDMYQSYFKSGAVHVLAISGLHIGIVLMFLITVLKPLKYIKNGNNITIILVLLILWSFAVVSGLSASVVRAVTMYSFVAFALFLNRKSNIINSLWVSMFVLLVIYPKFLFDVGFQLSYLAVFSIVYLQPILKKSYRPKYKITRYFYDLLTVSVAAQLGVMPLSIYYFHQFPGLFFITNLLVIPIITAVLFLGFFSIIVSFFIDIPFFMVKILDFLVGLMNFIVIKISSFNSFVLTNIYSTFLLTILTSVLIFYLFNYLQKKRIQKLKYLLIILIITFSTFYFYQIKNYNHTESLVFYDSNELILLEKKGFQLNCISTKIQIENQDFESYKRENFIDKITFISFQNFMVLGNKKVLVLDDNLIISKPLTPDFLILHNNPKINLERLIINVKPNKVIFSPKNYKNNIEYWTKILKKNKIPFHNMYEKGFCMIE